MIAMAIEPELGVDGPLALRAQQGDRAALERLYGRYQRRILGLCRTMLGAQSEWSDVAQEIFLKACSQIERFDTSRRFHVWLFTLARNVVIDHLRRRGAWWDIERDLNRMPPKQEEDASDPILRTEGARKAIP